MQASQTAAHADVATLAAQRDIDRKLQLFRRLWLHRATCPSATTSSLAFALKDPQYSDLLRELRSAVESFMDNRRVVSQRNALNDPNANPWRRSGDFDFLILYAIFGNDACQSHQFLSALRDLSAIPNLSFAQAVERIQAAQMADRTKTSRQGVKPRHARDAIESCKRDGMQMTRPRATPKQWTETHGKGRKSSGKDASEDTTNQDNTVSDEDGAGGTSGPGTAREGDSDDSASDAAAASLQAPGGSARPGATAQPPSQTQHADSAEEEEDTADAEASLQSIELGRAWRRHSLLDGDEADDSLQVFDDDVHANSLTGNGNSFLDDDSFAGFDFGDHDHQPPQDDAQTDAHSTAVEGHFRVGSAVTIRARSSRDGPPKPQSAIAHPASPTSAINNSRNSIDSIDSITDSTPADALPSLPPPPPVFGLTSPSRRPRPSKSVAPHLLSAMSKRNNFDMTSEDTKKSTKRVRFSDEIMNGSPFESALADLSTQPSDLADLMQASFDFFLPSANDERLLASCRPEPDRAKAALIYDSATGDRPLCLAVAADERCWVLGEYNPKTDSLKIHCPEEMLDDVALDEEEVDTGAEDNNSARSLVSRFAGLLESVRQPPAPADAQEDNQPARQRLSASKAALPAFRKYSDSKQGARNRLIETAGSVAGCAVLLTLGRNIPKALDGHLWIFAIHTAAQLSEDMNLIGRMPESPTEAQSRLALLPEGLDRNAGAVATVQVAHQAAMDGIRFQLDEEMRSRRSVEQFKILRSAISFALASRPQDDSSGDAQYIAGLRRQIEIAPASRRANLEAFLRTELATQGTTSNSVKVWKDVNKQLGFLQVHHSDAAEASHTKAFEIHDLLQAQLENTLTALHKLGLKGLEGEE